MVKKTYVCKFRVIYRKQKQLGKIKYLPHKKWEDI